MTPHRRASFIDATRPVPRRSADRRLRVSLHERYRTGDAASKRMLQDDLDMWGFPDLDDDVSVTRFGPGTRRALESVLVPVAGGPNSETAVGVAADLARVWNASLRLLTVVPPASGDAAATAADTRLRGYAADIDAVPVDICVCSREDVVAALVEHASAHDVVVVGGSERSLFRRLFAGTVPKRLAGRSNTPLFVVERTS